MTENYERCKKAIMKWRQNETNMQRIRAINARSIRYRRECKIYLQILL